MSFECDAKLRLGFLQLIGNQLAVDVDGLGIDIAFAVDDLHRLAGGDADDIGLEARGEIASHFQKCGIAAAWLHMHHHVGVGHVHPPMKAWLATLKVADKRCR